MTRDLLIRGMIAGILAAILATLFARALAEPQIDLAIAYEASHSAHEVHNMPGMAPAKEPELVTRTTQKGLGLLTALTLYGAAAGGIFSLVFAATYGRLGSIGPRTLALLLALAAFIAIALVPALKYPPTPPAVGQHETVAFRTIAYFSMIALSVVAMLVSIKICRAFAGRLGSFDAMLAGGAAYVVIIAAVQCALPVINEVPADFPALVLWDFRVASIAIQAVLWVAVGIVFGALAESALRKGIH